MRRLGWVLVAVLAGCSVLPPPAGIQLTIPAAEDVSALPVTVVDHAGIVRDATTTAVPAGFLGETSVRAVPGRDDAVVFAWTGGGCDDRAIVTIDPSGDRFLAKLDTQSTAVSCSSVEILRAVLLSLARPVPADAFAAR